MGFLVVPAHGYRMLFAMASRTGLSGLSDGGTSGRDLGLGWGWDRLGFWVGLVKEFDRG